MEYEVRWYLAGAKRGRYWHAKGYSQEEAGAKVQELRTVGFKHKRRSGVQVFVPAGQIRRIEVRPLKAKA